MAGRGRVGQGGVPLCIGLGGMMHRVVALSFELKNGEGNLGMVANPGG